jgi:hypothetical protein
MSYFSTEKKMLLSISAISSSTTLAVGLTEVDLTIFNGQALTQIASSIGYPSISVSGATISLDAGWKYVLEMRIKVSDSSLSTSEYLKYFFADTSNVAISSIGNSIIYRDSNAVVAQEKCIFYVDASASSFSCKMRTQKLNSTGTVTINSSLDTETTSMTSYVLIKAWK